MQSNFFRLTKMQFCALDKVVRLQLLCFILFPLFFHKANQNIEIRNILMYSVGLWMLAYLVLRNFAFNDEKYKTTLLFHILPVTRNMVIGTRGIIVYGLCLAVTPLLILLSHMTHAIRPEFFAVIQLNSIPRGLLLAGVMIPVEFLVFYVFGAQKADFICVLVTIAPFFLIALFFQSPLSKILQSPYWIIVLVVGIMANIFCYMGSICFYRRKE